MHIGNLAAEILDPLVNAVVSVSEVRMSPDLKIAAFVSPLGAKDADAVIKTEQACEIRAWSCVGRAPADEVHARNPLPARHFLRQFRRINDLLKSPEVARDLGSDNDLGIDNDKDANSGASRQEEGAADLRLGGAGQAGRHGLYRAVSRSSGYSRPKRPVMPAHLDPLASGMLPIALGEVTKTVPYVQDGARFIASWLPGAGAFDRRPRRRMKSSDRRPAEVDVLALMPKIPHHHATPPQFSAIKISGERAYDLAREGNIDIPAREVESAASI
jgi:hypothetical protein